MSEIDTVVNPALGALGAYQNAQRGTPVGYAKALAGGIRTLDQFPNTNLGALGKGAGYLNNVANIYGGIQQGGALGYGSALSNSMQLGGKLLNMPGVSQVGGYIAAPLSLYNAIQGWESGDTGGNALRGASAGASIGSIVPGIGTVIGGLIGGAVGALSSVFGPGKTSQGQLAWDAYQKKGWGNLEGTQLDTKAFEEPWLGAWQSKHNRKFFDTFTQLGNKSKHGGNAEGFKGWLVDQVADGIANGQIKQGMDSNAIYKSVIQPAMDNYWKQTGSSMSSAQWDEAQKSGHLNTPDIIVTTLDRIMAGAPVSRHDENYDGKAGNYQDIPDLAEAMKSRGYAGNIGGSAVQRGALQRAINPKNNQIDYYRYGEANPEHSFFVDTAQELPGYTARKAPPPPPKPPAPTGIEGLRGLMGGALGNIDPTMLQNLVAQAKKKIPATPTAPQAVMARGGALAYAAGSPPPRREHYVGSRTPSSGRADDIDAKLANNEYVMDAETVALLGDGNPDEGARRLDELRARLRAHKGKALAKGKFSPDAKSPESYLGGR